MPGRHLAGRRRAGLRHALSHPRIAAINSILSRGETALHQQLGHYLELRQEIAAYVEDRCHVSYDPENEILVTVGAPARALILRCARSLNPGDEVLVPEPSYVSYAPVRDLRGRRARWPCPTSEANNFGADSRGDWIRSRITPQAPRR